MGETAIETLARGGEVADAPKPKSLADELRETREKLSEESKPKLFKLDGYGSKLQVKYKVVTYEEVSEISEKVADQIRAEQIDDAVLAGLSDTLVASCVGFYTERDGKVIPLEEAEPGYEGPPIRWGDERLVKFLGIQPQPGETLRVRAIIREVLGGDKALVIEHAQDVTSWMERARRQVDTDF